MLSIGSLFSGIGGLELGLERAGLGPTLWQVEQDIFCRSVLAKHWAHVERFEDVRTVGTGLPRVDLICGGFPCQDVSSAGKGAGLAGERSGLWFEFSRIVSECKPRWVVVENVASGAKRWVDAVRADLGRLGYKTLPLPLSAQDVGAPHLRKRIFIVGRNTDGDRQPTQPQHGEVARVRRDSAGSDAADANLTGLQGAGTIPRPLSWKVATGSPWATDTVPEPAVRRVVDGVPSRLEQRLRNNRLKALGNSVVPQCAEVVGWVIRELMA